MRFCTWVGNPHASIITKIIFIILITTVAVITLESLKSLTHSERTKIISAKSVIKLMQCIHCLSYFTYCILQSWCALVKKLKIHTQDYIREDDLVRYKHTVESEVTFLDKTMSTITFYFELVKIQVLTVTIKSEMLSPIPPFLRWPPDPEMQRWRK